MIAGPVAVIPLACGRLELGLWPCGRLETMDAGPVAVDMLPTTYDRLPTTGKALLGRRALSCQEQRRLNACRKEHAYNAYREEHLSAYKMDVHDYFGTQKSLVFSGKAQPVTVLDSSKRF